MLVRCQGQIWCDFARYNFAALVGLVVSPSFVGSFDIAFVRCVTCQVYLNREGLIGPYGMVPPPVVSWC
jgi:hypothetical protein